MNKLFRKTNEAVDQKKLFRKTNEVDQ